MAEMTLDEFLRDNSDAIGVAVQERMRGDETMHRIATQRELGETQLVSQVLGFWLQAIRTDLSLGSTAALAQNMGWLANLRSGHDLPFEDAMVQVIFDELSDEIEARLLPGPLAEEYATYRVAATALIAAAFPGQSEADA